MFLQVKVLDQDPVVTIVTNNNFIFRIGYLHLIVIEPEMQIRATTIFLLEVLNKKSPAYVSVLTRTFLQ